MTTFEPGASEVFTHGFALRPFAAALRAKRPAPISTLGFEVLVQDVIAAMTTSPWPMSKFLPSTAKRFVMVRYLEPAVGEPPCWHLRGTVWEGPGDQGVDLEGDVDRVTSVGDYWAFHFLANSAMAAAVTLTFDLRAHSATLDTAGEREACIAFRLSR